MTTTSPIIAATANAMLLQSANIVPTSSLSDLGVIEILNLVVLGECNGHASLKFK